MNLFGLSVWWDRVCRPEKRLNAKQSNQNAKLQFMSNFSPSVVARRKNIMTNRPEKSANLTEDVLRVNKKRSRGDENILMGESKKIQRK